MNLLLEEVVEFKRGSFLKRILGLWVKKEFGSNGNCLK